MNCEALTKEKWEVRDGDLLEIFPPDDLSETWRLGDNTLVASLKGSRLL